MNDYERNARSAYCRRFGAAAPEPSNTTDEFKVDGKDYLALTNANGVLAIYQVKDDCSVRYVKSPHIYKVFGE